MKPNQTFELGLNQFADWTAEERSQMLNTPSQTVSDAYLHALTTDQDLPESVNWVNTGAVAPVRNQGQSNCGIHAFTACEQMQGQHFIQTGRSVKLSEQQCIDCGTGCQGVPDECMTYVKTNGGIQLE